VEIILFRSVDKYTYIGFWRVRLQWISVIV